MSFDPYLELDVERDADADAIKRAHRRKAREHHPDAGGDRDQFEQVQRAYLILIHPGKRARFDRTGDVDEEPDNEFAGAAAKLVGAFDTVVSKRPDPAKIVEIDLMEAVRSLLAVGKKSNAEQRASAKQVIERMGDVCERLVISGDGPDVLGNELRSRMDGISRMMAELDRDDALIDRAIAMADGYTFRFDAPDEQKHMGFAWR